MLALDTFKVRVEADEKLKTHLDVTLDQLAANTSAMYMLQQATEIRTLCDTPLVYQGRPIVPQSVEITIALLEQELYIKEIKLNYIDSRTKNNHTTTMTYGDFISIAESRKKQG